MSNTKAEVEQEVGYYALPRRRKIFWGRVLMSTRRLYENSREAQHPRLTLIECRVGIDSFP